MHIACAALAAGLPGVQADEDACCEACVAEETCNVWVFCGHEDGCGGGHAHGECWLKHGDELNVQEPAASRGDGAHAFGPTAALTPAPLSLEMQWHAHGPRAEALQAGAQARVARGLSTKAVACRSQVDVGRGLLARAGG
jgi:PAN domain